MKKLVSLLLVLCMVLSLGAALAEQPIKLRIAYMPNMGSASLLVTARDFGFFAEQGLDVELIQFQSGPPEIAAMASGDVDISQIGHGAHALCVEGQALVIGLDQLGNADFVIGNKDKGVNTVEDLKGKKVAMTAGTSAEIILDLALENSGLTKADLEIVEMDANGIVSAMISGAVDAVAAWSPGTTTIINAMGDKAVLLANNKDYLDFVAFPGSFVINPNFLEPNRDKLLKFLVAVMKASDYRAANIEEVATAVAKECEVDAEIMIAGKNDGYWVTADYIGNGLKDGTIKSLYENQQKLFVKSGRIAEAVPVENYVVFDLFQEAYDLYLASK